MPHLPKAASGAHGLPSAVSPPSNQRFHDYFMTMRIVSTA